MCLKDKVKECGIAYGMDVYTNNELIALMTGVSEEKAEEINMDDPFSNDINGIGMWKKMAIAAINECARRKYAVIDHSVKVIHGPEDVNHYIGRKLMHEQKEHFGLVLLNTKNHIIGYRDVSIGSLNASIVHPREVFFEAINAHAASVILVHNHPSGDPSPSREDINITERLVKSGRIIDIPVLDHIIVGKNRFISLKERGVMC